LAQKHYLLNIKNISGFVVIAQALSFCIVASADAKEHVDITGMQRSALTSMAITTDWEAPPDEDDPGAGGGHEAVSYFRTSLVELVPECTNRIKLAFTDWTQKHDLYIPVIEHKKNKVLAYANKNGLDGIFEFSYRVDLDAELARASLYFYSNNGEKHELNSILEVLEEYGINSFQDRLGDELSCGAG